MRRKRFIKIGQILEVSCAMLSDDCGSNYSTFAAVGKGGGKFHSTTAKPLSGLRAWWFWCSPCCKVQSDKRECKQDHELPTLNVENASEDELNEGNR